MNQEQQSILLRSASRFPIPTGTNSSAFLQYSTRSNQCLLPAGAKFSYGTSGFRADASLLESTVFRVGILAALRSIQTRSVIGLMITASHNQVSDNGVKLADPSGGMLTQSWEPFADALANAPNPHSLLQVRLPTFVLQLYVPFVFDDFSF